ncbi:transcriptional regulator [Halobacteriales archaeon QS_8_69_26]|nr:MAG: transcriptional regulator [Halobacteriales archaeon QS_8_69_26]
MSRSALIGNVTAMLEDAGFSVSQRVAVRPKSFDLAARRGEDLILLKILGNIDAFDARTGEEMRRLGDYLGATPLVIGLRSRDEKLEPDVVYFRHGVPVFNPDTAMDLFVEGVPPLVYAAPGGLYVTIDSDVVADEREKRDWSLGRLAQELGVSRRTVSKYEDGMNASIEVAMELEELFDRPLTSPIRVFDGAEEVRDADPMPEDPEPETEDEPIVAAMTAAGFDVHPTLRAPFKAVGEDDDPEERVLTGHSALTEAARKRARLMGSLGRITRSRSVYFVDEATDEELEGTAFIERDEVEDSDPDRLRDLIRERTDGKPA